MSATLTVDPKKYARLANRIVVKAIETEREYDHTVAAVKQLIDKGEDHLSPEESALLETMAILIQAYDDRHHPLPSVAPSEMLAYLMETSGRAAKDLLPVFGTRGRVSEVLSGKRSSARSRPRNSQPCSRSRSISSSNSPVGRTRLRARQDATVRRINRVTTETVSSTALTGIAPQFLVDDLDAAIAYYRDKLGFDVDFCYESFYASVSRNGFAIHLNARQRRSVTERTASSMNTWMRTSL